MSFLPSKISVFVDTGLSIVAACGRCWVTIPAIASARRYWNCSRLSFDFLVFVQLLVNCCLVILVLTGSDIDVMMGCVVLQCVL